MNILWITLESILPANSGGRIGVFKRLEQVSKTEKIFLFYPYDEKGEIQYKKDLEKYCEEVHAYSRQKNRKNALRKLLKYPYTVASRDIQEMKVDIKNCIKENKIDVINVDFPHMCVNILDLDIEVPIVLNEHNIEWKVYKNIAKSKRNIFKKCAYFIDSFRLKKYELRISKKLDFSRITFVSSEDLNEMVREGIYEKEKTVLIPVGADLIEKLPDVEKKGNKKTIIFVGKMSYGPNIEAAKWFVNSVFPLIYKSIPEVVFYIVGKDPTDEVKSLSSETVVVTGMVDSVEEYYENADLVVLPLRNGGGVKVKLLEAISYKKPIISTSIGVEGTLYSDRETIPVYDSTNEFATACINALDSLYVDKYEEMYRLFVKNYAWDKIGEKYILMFRDVI